MLQFPERYGGDIIPQTESSYRMHGGRREVHLCGSAVKKWQNFRGLRHKRRVNYSLYITITRKLIAMKKVKIKKMDSTDF